MHSYCLVACIAILLSGIPLQSVAQERILKLSDYRGNQWNEAGPHGPLMGHVAPYWSCKRADKPTEACDWFYVYTAATVDSRFESYERKMNQQDTENRNLVNRRYEEMSELVFLTEGKIMDATVELVSNLSTGEVSDSIKTAIQEAVLSEVRITLDSLSQSLHEEVRALRDSLEADAE